MPLRSPGLHATQTSDAHFSRQYNTCRSRDARCAIIYIRNVSAFKYILETHCKEAFDPPMNRKTSIGIIGCGTISSTYLKAARLFDILQVVACADIDMERAHRQGEKYGVPKVCTVEELLADPEIEIVVNLTIPNAHAEVALKAIAAGKAVYGEKPLATRRAD